MPSQTFNNQNENRKNGHASRPVVIIAGPTASGKSSLAIAVAERYPGVIINADSQQVYKGLSILSAAPSPDDTARLPHRLFAALDAGEVCSAGRWLAMAVAEIRATWAAGLLPVVTGGTGMYLLALTAGLSPIPEVPAELRNRARALFTELGGNAFRQRLAELDPASGERLEATDRQRLIRAYEVSLATGRPFSAWRAEPRTPALPEARFATVVLAPDRPALYAAIDARLDAMVAAGALDEVRALLARHTARGWDAALPVMKALGVSELAAHLQGEMTLEAAVARAKTRSRNYAKRQLTWLRHQLTGKVLTVATGRSAQDSESLRAEIFSFIDGFLLTENP